MKPVTSASTCELLEHARQRLDHAIVRRRTRLVGRALDEHVRVGEHIGRRVLELALHALRDDPCRRRLRGRRHRGVHVLGAQQLGRLRVDILRGRRVVVWRVRRDGAGNHANARRWGCVQRHAIRGRLVTFVRSDEVVEVRARDRRREGLVTRVAVEHVGLAALAAAAQRAVLGKVGLAVFVFAITGVGPIEEALDASDQLASGHADDDEDRKQAKHYQHKYREAAR